MSTKTMALSFEELFKSSSQNAAETVPTERAVQLTIDTLKAGEVLECDIYKAWATSLFRQYGPKSFNSSDLHKLLNVFTTTIEQLLYECHDCVNAEQASKLLAFLNNSIELFTWIHSVAREFGTNDITTFLCFGLSFINSYLEVHSKHTASANTSKLLEKSLSIQKLIIIILSENPMVFCFDKDSASLFIDLISHLTAVGELTPKLDIKTAVDVWKSIARLTSQYASQRKSENYSLDDTDWLKRPMSFLINEIGRNTQTVYKEDSLSEPIHLIEKYLKVTNFYLRLLQKLAADFRHVLFPVCEDFLNTLAVVLSPPDYILNTPVEKVILEYISKGYKDLIPYVYKNDLFFELLLSEHIERMNKSEVFYAIVLEVVEIACRKNEVGCINPLVFDAALQRLSKCAHIFISTSTYNRLVQAISSVQVQFHHDQIQTTLIKCVLQDEIILALASIDIWTTMFRVSDAFTRLTYFQFWRDINEKFTKYSNRLSALYVEVLLKNMYGCLTVKEKSEIWNEFNACTLSDDRFLLAVGLDSIPNTVQKQSVIQHFVNELVRFLKESSNGMTVDNFYTIVRDLRLLTPISFRNDEIIEMLLCYVNIAIKNIKFNIFLQSILGFLGSKLEFINDNKILKILTVLSSELATFEEHSTKLSLIEFLKKVSAVPRLAKHSEKLLKVLESDELIRTLANREKNATAAVDVDKSAQIFQEILKKRSIERIKWSHVCPTDEDMHVTKKMKTNMKTQDLLVALECNVNDLQTLSELTTSSIEIIKRIISKLQSLGAIS